MAFRSGLVVFALVLIASFQSVLTRKRVNSDDSQLNVLVNQLVNVKGIERCNILIDSHFKSQVVGKIHAKLAKLLPVMSIEDSKKVQWAKYKRKRLYYASTSKDPRKRPHILNCVSGNSLVIFFHQPSNQHRFHQSMKRFQDALVQPASVPKLLVIAVTNKSLKSYRTPLHRLFKTFNMVDVEILEISESVRARKSKKKNGMKQNLHSFSVHGFNPFTRIYKKQRLTKRVEWFQMKTMNLRGFKIKTEMYSFVNKRVLNNKTFSLTSEFFNDKSKFATALKSLMNITYIYEENEASQDLIFSETYCVRLSTAIALKPHLLDIVHIYTPVIFDTYVKINFMDFLLFFSLMLITVLVLNFLSGFGEFHHRTWSPFAIFKMLLGKENPTGVTGSLLETFLFILISFTGIFFSNEFSNAVTSILRPITIERHLNTFEDIKDCNLTMHLLREPPTVGINGYSLENPILKSNVKYHKTYLYENGSFQLLFNATSRMLHSFDTSVSFSEGPRSMKLFGPTIQVDGRALIKRSGMSESKYISSCPLKPFSPYNERMSDIYWRFYEVGFHNLMNFTAYVTEVNKYIRHEYFLKTQQDVDDSHEIEINFCLIYCGILLFGSILAISILIVEILLARSLSTNQTRNRVSFKDDAHFVCYMAEFFELEEPAENTITKEENAKESVQLTDESLQVQNENCTEERCEEESTNEIVVSETFDVDTSILSKDSANDPREF